MSAKEDPKDNQDSSRVTQETEKEVSEKEGIVVYLDILGYQSFLENNESASATREVLRVLNGIGKIAETSFLKEYFDNDPEFYNKKISPYLRWLVFSDTILLTASIPKDAKAAKKATLWLAVLEHTAEVSRRLFDFGLPVRGAITYGKFMVDRACFAGRPIVEAHQVSSKIDLAACVFSDASKQELERVDSEVDFNGQLSQRVAIPYLVPFKDGTARKFLTINPFGASDRCGIPSDISQAVATCFWKHDKDLSPCAYPKMKNTELFLRFLKMKSDEDAATGVLQKTDETETASTLAAGDPSLN